MTEEDTKPKGSFADELVSKMQAQVAVELEKTGATRLKMGMLAPGVPDPGSMLEAVAAIKGQLFQIQVQTSVMMMVLAAILDELDPEDQLAIAERAMAALGQLEELCDKAAEEKDTPKIVTPGGKGGIIQPL